MLRKWGLLKKPAVRPNVVTMARNIVNVLDPALLRAGRFDRKLTIDKPDEEGRKDIIEYYLAKVRHEDMPLDRMSGDTIGYTPVEIKYVINEATVVAYFGHDAVSYRDFSEAREAHEFGIKQPIRGMKLEEKRAWPTTRRGTPSPWPCSRARPSDLQGDHPAPGRAAGHGGLQAGRGAGDAGPGRRSWPISRSLASRAAEELFLNTQMNGFTGDLQHATWRPPRRTWGSSAWAGRLLLPGFGNSLTGMPDKRVEELLGDQAASRRCSRCARRPSTPSPRPSSPTAS